MNYIFGSFQYLLVVMLTTLILFPTTTPAMEIMGVAKFVVDSGGESMDKVPSLSPTTTRKVRANDVYGAVVGLTFINDARNFSMDATLGAKSSWPHVGRGSLLDYSLSRGELEVLAFYVFPAADTGKARIRFGIGPTLHINPSFEESGTLNDGTVIENTTEFDSAIGLTLQLDSTIPFSSKRPAGITFGIRYSSANYNADNLQSIRASGLGIFVGGTFPVGLNRK